MATSTEGPSETKSQVTEEKTVDVKKVQKPEVKKNPLQNLFGGKKVASEKKEDSPSTPTKVEKQNPLKKFLERGSRWSNPNKSEPKTKAGTPDSNGAHTSSGDSSPSSPSTDHKTESHSEGHSKTSE